MKIIQSIVIILIFSSCKTFFDKNKIDHKLELKPILDKNVFLPNSTVELENEFLKNICQNWVDSKEDKDQIIWRPKSYKEFPKIRFRGEIIFNTNGEYSILKLLPNDAHYFEKYRWRLDKENHQRIVVYNSKGEIEKSMTIDKLDEVTLIFRKNK